MNSKTIRAFIIIFIGSANLILFQNCQNYSGQISSSSLGNSTKTQDGIISIDETVVPCPTLDPCSEDMLDQPPSGSVTQPSPGSQSQPSPNPIPSEVTPVQSGNNDPSLPPPSSLNPPDSENNDSPSSPGSNSNSGNIVKDDTENNDGDKNENEVPHNSNVADNDDDDGPKSEEHSGNSSGGNNSENSSALACDPRTLGINNSNSIKILELSLEANDQKDLSIPSGVKLVRYRGAQKLHLINVSHQSDTQICGNIHIENLNAHGGFVITNVEVDKVVMTGNLRCQKHDGNFVVDVGTRVAGQKTCRVNDKYEIVDCINKH